MVHGCLLALVPVVAILELIESRSDLVNCPGSGHLKEVVHVFENDLLSIQRPVHELNEFVVNRQVDDFVIVALLNSLRPCLCSLFVVLVRKRLESTSVSDHGRLQGSTAFPRLLSSIRRCRCTSICVAVSSSSKNSPRLPVVHVIAAAVTNGLDLVRHAFNVHVVEVAALPPSHTSRSTVVELSVVMLGLDLRSDGMQFLQKVEVVL
mmetsp:Transcript_12788/g.15452  ORF Transcript_12788/g.15452 Transcript_12788/m.15452 type:complete len:207 (-) Transcript_12788:1091-1711(-)